MKTKILIDMDGVLADVYKPLIMEEYTKNNKIINESDLNGIAEYDAFPNLRKIVTSNNFFRNAPIMDGSIEGLKYLNEKYDVLIVSSATEFPNCINDKQNWLEEQFPFISLEQMIFCGKKESVCGDIMIDDHPKNLVYFKGKKIIFTQPHNYNINNSEYIRVFSWKEIQNIL